MAAATDRPAVLAQLAQLAHDRPLERKRIICARWGAGRELLRALAASGVSWIGFELVTPGALAHELVADALLRHGLEPADPFDELAMLDDAIDAVLGGDTGGLSALAESHGLRQAIAASVQALRLAGIGPPALERARFRDEEKRAQIARILDRYEVRLRAAACVDAAAVCRMAAEALELGTSELARAHYFILPGLAGRGLPGALLEALRTRGAVLLAPDPVHGLTVPAGWLSAPEPGTAGTPLSWLHDVANVPSHAAGVELELFAASSITGELREVLRRITAAGHQWDQVEIIATDAVAYGVALDGLARRLDIGVTYAAGLPLARTRPGRAVAKYLEWVEAGLPADLLRQMLERGDVAVDAGEQVSGTGLARLLRRLRVGRGPGAYARAFARAEQDLATRPEADEDDARELAAVRERRVAELAALRALVEELLANLPPAGHVAADVSTASLARAVRVLLARVPAHTAADRVALGLLCDRLDRLAATAVRATTLRSAIAILLSKLDARVPAPDAAGAAPWLSAGGHLHLSDLEHGGWTGRAATFLVGLDAGRFPGGSGSDALLVDDDRRRLTADQQLPALPTAADRLEERRYALAQLLARLRGRVTLSYAAWDAVEGRATAPAAELLQAFRLATGNRNADYEALHAALEPAASPVPHAGALLDADDVWLETLAHQGVLRYGVPQVIALHPHLAAGVAAYRARLGEPSAHHGIVRARPGLDPRDDGDREVTPTQLETLGRCPLRYLHRYVLRVRPPEDPDLTAGYWLSPGERGTLMHEIFERALRAVSGEALDIDTDAFETRVLEITEEVLHEQRSAVPPPGEAIYEVERERTREDARAFVAMVREDGGRWIALEERFGPGTGRPAVPVTLPDGRVLHVAGRIDRIDRLPDGSTVVIDYKTGSRARFEARMGPFDGGRRLQHVLYAAVARTLHGAEVARAEYHFPTRRNENHRARYGPQVLRDGLAVVSDLLDLAAAGTFVPTTDPDDCGICDHRAACRVRDAGFGRTASPPAEWARTAGMAALDVLRGLRR